MSFSQDVFLERNHENISFTFYLLGFPWQQKKTERKFELA